MNSDSRRQLVPIANNSTPMGILKERSSSSSALIAKRPSSTTSRPATTGLKLPKDWRNRRVNQDVGNSNKAGDLTKNEWENEIARHILSLYATSIASEEPDTLNTSKSIVSFVNNKRPESAALITIKDDVYLASPLKPEESDQNTLKILVKVITCECALPLEAVELRVGLALGETAAALLTLPLKKTLGSTVLPARLLL